MTTGIVTLKAGRERSILRQHPWIFSGGIGRAQDAIPGEVVTVVDAQGQFLARGYWNPKSQIQVRILTWDDEPIDRDWWRRQLARAIGARVGSRPIGEVTARLVNAENDFLPGLVVDAYAGWLVFQALTLYVDKHKDMLVELLAALCQPYGIYERSDVDVRGKEGLKDAVGVRWGAEPPDEIASTLDGVTLLVDVRTGHKTGAYLDQTRNRAVLRQLTDGMARPLRVLNLFSFTGAFGLAVSDAQVRNVDSSLEALALGQRMAVANGRAADDFEWVQADCFQYVRACAAAGEQFEVVILDPPKFAHSAAQVEKAARAYKDLNLHAFRVVRPGGYLLTFSCSGAVDRDLFQKIVFGALLDSGRRGQMVQWLGAGEDHPVALTFPQGEYLKGLLVRVW